MKIRNGFVSNSSSASFVLSISNDKRNKNICKFLHDKLPQYFEKKGLMKAIKLDILEDKKRIKEYQNSKEDTILKNIWISDTKRCIKKNLQLLSEIGKINDEIIILPALVFYDYTTHLDNKYLKIFGQTVMYNDEKDIGSVMLDIKNICQKHKIFCELSITDGS